MSFSFGEAGERDRARDFLETEESSEAEEKCLDVRDGIGGARVGELVERP